jgi:acetylornithine deacetylase
MANAGVYYGVNPGRAEFACDIRTLPGMTREVLVEDLEDFLHDAMADDTQLRAELVFEIWVPATEMPADAPVVRALQEAARIVLGRELRVEAFPGSTDATHFQLTAGVPTVAAFGPGFLPRAHGPNESLSSASALEAAKIYALGAMRFLGGVA